MFLIFGGEFCYPNGGAADLLGSAETLKEAQQIAGELVRNDAHQFDDEPDDGHTEYWSSQGVDIQWVHILDVATKKVFPVAGRELHSGFDGDVSDIVKLPVQEKLQTAVTLSDGDTELTTDSGPLRPMINVTLND